MPRVDAGQTRRLHRRECDRHLRNNDSRIRDGGAGSVVTKRPPSLVVGVPANSVMSATAGLNSPLSQIMTYSWILLYLRQSVQGMSPTMPLKLYEKFRASQVVTQIAAEVIENDPRLSKKADEWRQKYTELRQEVESQFDQIEQELWEWFEMQRENGTDSS